MSDTDGPPAAADNAGIAAVFEQIATLLELEGANPFRIMAWRNAVWTVRDHPTPMGELIAAGEPLTDLPSIGKEIAGVIEDLVKTGRSTYLDQVALRVPRTLLDVMQLPGLGPKKAARLWRELGLTTLAALEDACRAGRVAELKGFGAKTEQGLLRRIEARRGSPPAAPPAPGEA